MWLPCLFAVLSLPTLSLSCLVLDSPCRCPTIKTITQAQIKKYPKSMYLGNRKVANPSFYVDRTTCNITVDVSKMTENSFYFMIFRSDNPPIFNRRFINAADKTVAFSPTGISCVRVENEYQWQYYGGKVTDMAFAMQPEECGCVEPVAGGAGPPATVSKLLNTCNIYQFSCSDKTLFPFVTRPYRGAMYEGLVQGRTSVAVVNDMTCVSKQWYFNNDLMFTPQAFCNRAGIVALKAIIDPPVYTCGCYQFDEVELRNLALLAYFDITGTYGKKKYNAGTIKYDANKCLAYPSCYGSDTLVIFSTTSYPKEYPFGSQPPYTTCKVTPMATGGNSQYFWISDGNMLSAAGYGCIVGCPCKYVKMTTANVKRLVGSYSIYQYISAYPMTTPSDKLTTGTLCPGTVSCASGYTLVVFDTKAVSTYSSGTLTAVCTASSRKWTVNKATDIPVMDQIFAICVKFPAA